MEDNGHFLLKDVIDVQQWQKILDNFSAITETCVRTVDHKGQLVTKPTREPRLCGELLRRSPLRYKFCGPCLPTFLGGTGMLDKNLKFPCFAGLCNLIAPLRLNSEDETVLGYIILGPVIMVARKEREYYRPMAEELHVDAEDLWNALLEVRVISIVR